MLLRASTKVKKKKKKKEKRKKKRKFRRVEGSSVWRLFFFLGFGGE
jgi:hypothetical protein